MSETKRIYFRNANLAILLILSFMFSFMGIIFALGLLLLGQYIIGGLLLIFCIFVLSSGKAWVKSLEKGYYLDAKEQAFVIDYKLSGMAFGERHPFNRIKQIRSTWRFANKSHTDKEYYVELTLDNGKIYESFTAYKSAEPAQTLLKQIESFGLEVK
jgi:hypothetical protein